MDPTSWMKDRACLRAILVLCLSTPAFAGCDSSDIAGVWLAKAEGVVVKPEWAAGPFVRAGLLSFQDDGSLLLTAFTSDRGGTLSETTSGRYLINPDCTVEIRFQSARAAGGSVSEQYAGALGNNGKEITLLLTSPPGTSIGMTATRLRSVSCGPADLRGRYTLELAGWENGSRVRRAGVLTADGEGAFRAAMIASDPAAGPAGEIRTEALAGTYTVTEACRLELRTRFREVGGPATGIVQAPFAATFRGAGFDAFEHAALVEDSPGAVVSGLLVGERLLLGTPPPVQLLVSTTSLSFTASPSSPARSASFSYSLSDGGSRAVSVQGAAQSGGWLSVQQSGGTTPGSGTVSINASGLAPGAYAGSVTVSVSGVGSATIGVVLTVTSP